MESYAWVHYTASLASTAASHKRHEWTAIAELRRNHLRPLLASASLVLLLHKNA